MQKRILLSLLLGVIFSISIFSQNLKVEKITLPDSEIPLDKVRKQRLCDLIRDGNG